MTEKLNSIEGKLDNVIKHIDEHIRQGEERGGWRDRQRESEEAIRTLRIEVSVIKKGYWKVGLACGFVGALLGHLTPELTKLIVTFLKLSF